MENRRKMIRLTGKSLDLANELIDEFKRKGYRSSWTAVVDSSIPLLHGVTLGGYNVVSYAEQLEQRIHDVGTSIAAVIGALCSARVDMAGCQLGYLPEVDAMGIRLDAVADIILVHAGGGDPAAIGNVVADQLRSRGYLADDGTGTVVVDMDQLLGKAID